MRLQEIPPERYAREVLPATAKLWAGRRDFDTYVAHTLEIARSGYGRRHYRTIGLYDGTELVASYKQYERALRHGSHRLRAMGLGAVFTPAAYRGRGYASFMLGVQLDRFRKDGFDIAYLFSDIAPQFYVQLGFRELPSREIALRADTLASKRLEVARAEDRDWSGIARCFDLFSRTCSTGFLRSPLVWEWIRTRAHQQSEHRVGQETNLVLRKGRAIVAYVLGVRAPERDTYVVDEFGCADGTAAQAVPTLLRAAAGDLRRIAGWLPPSGARELLPRGAVRKRKHAIFMMAPLSDAGDALVHAVTSASRSDFCWATDHI
jgi:predicted acetyltransferase